MTVKRPIAKASVSLAHTYGNVLSIFTQYIKDLLPADYFKTVHVTSKIPFKDFDAFKNTQKEFIKKKKPMLIIRPRVVLNDTDQFLHGTYLTTRIFENEYAQNFGELQPFFSDDLKNVNLKYLMNRLTMELDVTMVVESQMEQINVAHYIQNSIRQNMSFIVPVALESNISREMLELLSKEVGVSMYDEKGSVKPFLDYLNGRSLYPITYKMKNSTGNDEFFRYYNTNVDVEFRDLQIDEASRKNFVNNSASINFSVRLEFTATGMYYLYSSKSMNNEFVFNFGILPSDSEMVPLFTTQKPSLEDHLPVGWGLYTSSVFKMDEGVKEDITELHTLFNNSTLNTIDYTKNTGTPISTLFRVSVMKDNEMLVENVDFIVNWTTLELKVTNCNSSSSYRVFIYINNNYVNEIVSSMINIDSEKPNFIHHSKLGDPQADGIKPYPKNTPLFMGVSNFKTVSAPLIKKLPLRYVSKAPTVIEYEHVANNRFVIMAIPKEFEIEFIRDENGIDCIDNFDHICKPLVLAAWGNSFYNIFVSKKRYNCVAKFEIGISEITEK